MALTSSLDVSTGKNIMTLVINQVKHGVRCSCSTVASVDYCVGTYFVDKVNTLELSIQELVDYVLHRYLMRLTSYTFVKKS